MTWNGAEPPVLPVPTLAARTGGGLRIAGIALATLILLATYALCQALFRGPGWRPHFGVQRLWARLCLAACGLRLRVEGTRMVTGGAIVANHISWIDIFAVLAAGRVNYVAKSEVRAWPAIGFIAAVTGTMFVERRATEAKRQQVEMAERIARGELLCFFPEGTSTDGLRVLPFKSSLFGAFDAPGLRERTWVQPVTVAYDAPGALPDALYGWWGTMPFGKHVWDVVTLSRRGVAVVRFHPPVPVAEFADRKALAAHCGRAVAAGMAEIRAAHPAD